MVCFRYIRPSRLQCDAIFDVLRASPRNRARTCVEHIGCRRRQTSGGARILQPSATRAQREGKEPYAVAGFETNSIHCNRTWSNTRDTSMIPWRLGSPRARPAGDQHPHARLGRRCGRQRSRMQPSMPGKPHPLRPVGRLNAGRGPQNAEAVTLWRYKAVTRSGTAVARLPSRPQLHREAGVKSSALRGFCAMGTFEFRRNAATPRGERRDGGGLLYICILSAWG